MNFLDKLTYLRDKYDTLDRFVKCHLIIRKHGPSEDFLKKIKSIFPSLPISYLNYLKLYDGLKIDWVVLYGSPNSEGVSLLEMLELYRETRERDFQKEHYCPIGEDSGADLYCLNKKGQIIMFDSVNVDNPPKLIAESFDEFVGECILGKRYLEFMDEDDFYYFLQKQGWA